MDRVMLVLVLRLVLRLVLWLVLLVLWRLLLMLRLHGEIRRWASFAALSGQFFAQQRGHQQAQAQQQAGQRRTQLLGLELRSVGAILLQEVGLFDPVSQLDGVRFQADGSGPAMELQKEATCVAQDLARLVTAP